MLIDGRWIADDVSTTDAEGRWQRAPSSFRNWITDDGRPGPTGEGGFTAEPGRYHLYAAWNCPWAHRALLVRAVKGLAPLIEVSFAAPARSAEGWIFDPAGEFRDALFGMASLHEIYTRSDPGFTGRVTVPVLWDRQRGAIVSNESADIVRMLNSAFGKWLPEAPDLYPEPQRKHIDAWNDRIHSTLNNGVYRAGFATTQSAYDDAVTGVFGTLDRLDAALSTRRFLCGEAPTEADWRLFPTLARFDVAYHSAFKCNVRRLTDYSHLWRYARTLYHAPGVAGTVRFDVYRRGYHSRSDKRNPNGIVPIGPDVDWSLPGSGPSTP